MKKMKRIMPVTYAKLEAERALLLEEIKALKEKNEQLEQKLDIQTMKIFGLLNRLSEQNEALIKEEFQTLKEALKSQK